MTLKVGDFVEWPGCRSDSNPHGVVRINNETELSGYESYNCHPVYVARAFELAGFPVPEGAKPYIVTNDGKVDWYHGFPSGHVNQESERQIFENGHWEDCSLLGGCWYLALDQSRTPVADCWDCLPAVVREAMEKQP